MPAIDGEALLLALNAHVAMTRQAIALSREHIARLREFQARLQRFQEGAAQSRGAHEPQPGDRARGGARR